MPAVSMGGISSGIDTTGIIEKLVNVEARPLKQYEEEKGASRRRKEALGLLSKSVNKLNDATKDLYGFRASYDDKKALSSDKEVLEATAIRTAEKGVTKIQVDKIASSSKISTDEIDEKKELPSGRIEITVNGDKRSLKFRGGPLKNLKDKIDETAPEILSTSYIRTSGSNHILTLESKVSGKKGEILLKGDLDFLKAIGLVKGEKGEKKDETSIVFDKKYFTSYIGEKKIELEDGNIQVSEDGKSVKIKGTLWQEYVLPSEISVNKDTILEFDFSYERQDGSQEEDDRSLPFRIETGPDEKVNIKGIELHGYNPSRIRDTDIKDKKRQFDSILGVGVVSMDDGKRIEKTYIVDKDSKVRQEIPIGKDFNGKKISKVIFYCNDGLADYRNAKISAPQKSENYFEAKNIIAPAEDAVVKVNGVEIKRDKNNDLNDVIKGVTLTLKMPSKQAVELSVSQDVEKPVEKIKKFVDAYNAYIDLHKELIKTEKRTKPGERSKNGENGPFVGDMTIIRLENIIRTTVNGAFPSSAENPIRMLSQMGVSTGKVNSEWETIKAGKLEIDEPALEKAIRDNPEGVKNFFGAATGGDTRVDNGMAYTLVTNLKPYISYGKNIIATKIDLEDNTITSANEKIERHTEHLKSYEAKLKKKFSNMEKAMSGAKSQRSWMNSQMGTSDKDKEK